MLRTDDDKAGIVFHGNFESEPYKGKNWAGSEKARHYVDCSVFEFSGANDVAHILIEELQETIPSIDWTIEHSKELLTDEQTFALKKLWYEKVDDIYIDDENGTVSESGEDEEFDSKMRHSSHFRCQSNESRGHDRCERLTIS